MNRAKDGDSSQAARALFKQLNKQELQKNKTEVNKVKIISLKQVLK